MVDQMTEYRQASAVLTELIASGSSDARLLAPALQRLDEIAEFGPDWDPNGAEPPSRWAVLTAKELLGTLLLRYGARIGAGIAPYHIAPMPDGSIQLKWRTDWSQGWLMIHPDASYSFLHEDRQNGEFLESDSIPLEQALAAVENTILPPR